MQKKRSRKTNVTTIAEEYMQTVAREDADKQDGAKEVKRVTARKFSLGSSKYTSWSDV